MANSFFHKLFHLIFFWLSKDKKVSNIPKTILNHRKSIHHAEKNAATKVINYCKSHFISVSEIELLFSAELKYETEKYRIQHEFPHLKEVLKGDIRIAKDEKYAFLKEHLAEDVYLSYYEARKKSKSGQ